MELWHPIWLKNTYQGLNILKLDNLKNYLLMWIYQGKGENLKRFILFFTLLYISLSLFAKTEKTYLNMSAEVFSKAYISFSNDKINITSNTCDYIVECITEDGDLVIFDKTLIKLEDLAIIKVSSI